MTRHIDIADPDEEEWDSESIQVAENDGFDRLGPAHVSLLDGRFLFETQAGLFFFFLIL